MRFVFPGKKPPRHKASQVRVLRGQALLTQLKDCLKWLRLGKFAGPLPEGVTSYKGKTIFYANTFTVLKPATDDGTPQWKGILDGSFITPFFGHKTVRYVRYKEIARMLQKVRWAWKADIKGGYKNSIRNLDDLHLSGMLLDGKTWLDCSMGMGYSVMCLLFSEITNAFCRAAMMTLPDIFTAKDVQLLLSYLDDLFGGAQTKEQSNNATFGSSDSWEYSRLAMENV